MQISSSRACTRSCAARVAISGESEAVVMGRAIGTVECETDAIAVEITVSFEAAVFVGFVLTRAVLIVGFEIVRISLAVWTAFEWVIAATMVFETAERIVLSCSVLTKLESLEWGAAGCEVI